MAKKVRNVFILDTSVLVYDHNALQAFENCDLILPITVVDELDKLKKLSNDVGRNARVVTRKLDTLLSEHPDVQGCKLPKGVIFTIDSSYQSSNSLNEYGDLRILQCAAKVQKENPEKKVVLVTRDINLRIRARSAGLGTQSYDREDMASHELYQGYRSVCAPALGKKLLMTQSVSCNGEPLLEAMFPNEFVLFTDKDANGVSAGRKIGQSIHLVTEKSPWGLHMRGKEQLFASNLLLDPNVPLVTLVGMAGSGKTLCAVAAALELVLNQRRYGSFEIYRPMETVGAEMGFLPGSVEEKLAPFYAPINDAFALLFGDKSKKKENWKNTLFQYMDSGIIKQEAIAFIRGRSIHNTLVLVDEAQNLTRDEMKTILTRVGEDSKIILCGDVLQIDQKSLDAFDNGLTCVVDKFKSYDLAGHVALNKGERSPLSALAARIL